MEYLPILQSESDLKSEATWKDDKSGPTDMKSSWCKKIRSSSKNQKVLKVPVTIFAEIRPQGLKGQWFVC